MNDKSGGPDLSAARQRETAAAIARQKVLESYSTNQKTTAYKQAPVQASGAQEGADWKKYHLAWQNYYQKYYNDYYAKAAKDYIRAERVKVEQARQAAERQRLEAEKQRQAAELQQQQMTERQRQMLIAQEEAQRAATEARKIIVSAPEEAVAPPPAVLTETPTEEEKRNIATSLKERIQARASDAAQKKRKAHSKHFWPIVAGVSTVVIALFLQYNRLIFAPIMAYVSPGNAADDGITAIDATVTASPGPDPKLIIPKLNVDVPVHFGISNDEATVMEAMNNGVAQFAIPGASAMPGQAGNLVITGHSAGDIYSNNQYKFIFSGLERLVAGDTIYVNYESKRYTYAVTELRTVEPTDVASLVTGTERPMLTLVTCTPLGTSRYRLLVMADQVDPSPEGAEKPAELEGQVASGSVSADSAAMPSNSPSFFEGIWRWLTGRS